MPNSYEPPQFFVDWMIKYPEQVKEATANTQGWENTPVFPRGTSFVLVKIHHKNFYQGENGHFYIEDTQHTKPPHYEVYNNKHDAEAGKRTRAVYWSGQPRPL
ncbi:unnamed protein product [Rotaria magnacalcarata]|uniref:Uncharacterized protein n=1 Tax=Rotaria magnacalcarata TaxID=392030 RepID=A0A816AC80_9BILA|nr:unnamed protein product [Rotaria magnacalcarata]CAF1595747.1 unnamed protein product [Rotaria magnacalcarata]CAF2086671.1 unnamed protein product [Rotaria magnacalcarata]CAF2205087.1 unnamed protein product [Rotaria magnacalcarata]